MTYSAKGTTYSYKTLKERFFRNTCCNFKKVVGPDGETYMALWNGLSYWLKILEFTNGVDMYDGVTVVEEFQTEQDHWEDGEWYMPNATIHLAIEAGYKVVE